jgi:hypothetical protein
VLFVANMEGAPRQIRFTDLPVPNLADSGWTLALKTPDLPTTAFDQAVTLHDSRGVVFVRNA